MIYFSYDSFGRRLSDFRPLRFAGSPTPPGGVAWLLPTNQSSSPHGEVARGLCRDGGVKASCIEVAVKI